MASNEIITIDGPAGTGKSTIAQLVARRLGWLYLNTGVMYRGLTYALLQLANDESVELTQDFIKQNVAEIRWDSSIKQDLSTLSCTTVFILENSEIADAELRTKEIDRNISLVAGDPIVRKACIGKQREIGSAGRIITEGRDQGSYVFTNAKYKFWLDATPEERARRRLKDYRKIGQQITLTELTEQIIRRDNADRANSAGVLVQSADAIVIDTTKLSIDEVVNEILSQID